MSIRKETFEILRAFVQLWKLIQSNGGGGEGKGNKWIMEILESEGTLKNILGKFSQDQSHSLRCVRAPLFSIFLFLIFLSSIFSEGISSSFPFNLSLTSPLHSFDPSSLASITTFDRFLESGEVHKHWASLWAAAISYIHTDCPATLKGEWRGR